MLPRAETSLQMRADIAENVAERFPNLTVNNFPEDDVWLINGRVLGDENLVGLIKTNTGVEKVFVKGDIVAAAFIKR